jgi:predicted nucleic acid-binding protein
VAAYFADSSALVKACVVEVGSSWLKTLLDPAAGNTLHVCRITAVESAAAIARRVSERSVTPLDAQQAIQDVRTDFALYYQSTEVNAALVDAAIDLTQRRPLRAYDAVQLTAALRIAVERAATGMTPFTFLCSDVRLTAAAQAEGLLTDDPNSHP